MRNVPPSHHNSPKSREEHMRRRRDAGLSIRNVAKEFGLPKSTVHRVLSDQKTVAPDNKEDK